MHIIEASNDLGLEIDLTSRTVKTFKITKEEQRLYIGGKGLGLKLLNERMGVGVDPLSPDNIIAFLTGILIGSGAPCSGRFSAVSKSPLSGLFSASSCGGPFGVAFRSCGYDALLIKGRSETPVIIEVTPSGTQFIDAETIWGKDTDETYQLLQVGSWDGSLVIGPAGEKMVSFANITSGNRFLGRAGFGAVLGSKKVKAIVARGQKLRLNPNEEERFINIRAEAVRKIAQNEFTSRYYPQYGTNANLRFNNENHILPVNNFQELQDEFAKRIYAEEIYEENQTKPHACKYCPIRCGHQFFRKDGTITNVPEYETLGLFGPNLGIFDMRQVADWNDYCGQVGMDTISTAVTISYAIEASQKGFLPSGLEFGNHEQITQLLTSIGERTDLGDDLAHGSRWMAEKYGGLDFAAQVKGMEMPAYDPRGSWGQGLAYAVANRGACHMSATLFPIEVYKGFLSPRTSQAKAEFVYFFENLYSIVNSLTICVFTSFAFLLEDPMVKMMPAFLLKPVMTLFPGLAIKLMDLHIFSELFSSITGIEISSQELFQAGERIHTLERLMNTREGVSASNDILPERFFNNTESGEKGINRQAFLRMRDKYYQIRGYDKKGIPSLKILRKLKIMSDE